MNDRSTQSVQKEFGKILKRFVYPSLFVFGLATLYCMNRDDCTIRTPDQHGYLLFNQKKYQVAAEHFSDPLWRAAALFKSGEFKQAAEIYAGYYTAEAEYNHGTSLVMLGKYEQAISHYQRAIELQPEWKEAQGNLEIARARAKLVKQEGGDMTGGQMGADEFVFTKGKSPPQSDTEDVAFQQNLTHAEMRAVWLRNVQTKPADFLQAKFAYQHALSTATPKAQVVNENENN